MIKWWKKWVFTEIRLEKLLWTHKMQSWKSCQISFAKGPKEMRKLSQKKYSSSKNSSGLSDFSFHNPTDKTSPVGRINFAGSPKKIKETVFLKKLLHFPKTFLWKGRLKYGQDRQTCLAESPKFSAGYLEPIKICVLSQLQFLFETLTRGRRFQCWQRHRNFSAKIQLSLLKLLSW